MKKGFTLVELLAVLTLIALIATLALKSITKTSNEMKSISQARFEELLISSAKAYMQEDEEAKSRLKFNKQYELPYKSLKESGYLSDDVVNLKSYNKINIERYRVCISYETYPQYTYTISTKSCFD